MEPWSLHRYRRPRLHVDTIGIEQHGHVVTLTAERQVYRLACDSLDGAERIAAELARLRDPDAPLWHVLRDSDPDSSWGMLGSFLDTRSLIGETADEAESVLATRAAAAADRAVEAAVASIEHEPPANHPAIRANAAAFLETIGHRSSSGGMADFSVDLRAAAGHPNFFLGLLGVEFSYMRRCAPVALCASRLLLSEIAGLNRDSQDVWRERIAADLGWLYSERDFDAHLTLVAHCIVRSADADAARFRSPPRQRSAPVPGLEFMRKAELLTRTVLRDWGPHRYGAAVDGLRDIGSPLVKGCYIEQYQVTQRYVEIITPMLHKRLSPPLRTLMYDYFSEELGHEEFELATCEALGMAKSALDRAIPLPLHQAFIDVLTEISVSDPVAFFATIMVTEGMLGDQSAVSDMLEKIGRGHRDFQNVSRRHDQLNKELHHTAIARHAFEHIAVVGAERQRHALDWLLFLLELNHRLWNGLADFYGPQSELRMHGFLGRPWLPQAAS
jgi:pyrroloquinoline quinone (PQQ) biosynthesis protein C